MPIYRYQAIAENGKKIRGDISAENLIDAKQKLIRLQIAAIQISPVSEKDIQKPLSFAEALSFTRDLARLLQAGLPLYEALSGLEEKLRGQPPHKILLDLCAQVKTGHPFSKALSCHSRSFDLLYVSMIASAEKTGKLAEAVEGLAVLLDRRQRMRKQIISALLYPGLLGVFCLLVLSCLLFFVIPSLEELFEGRVLHPFTQIVFSSSKVVRSSHAFFGCCSLILALAVSAWFGPVKWKKQSKVFWTNIPFVKALLAKIAFVRFVRSVAALLEGGLPLLAALCQARGVLNHAVLEMAVLSAEEKIREGVPLSVAFSNHPFIPPLVSRMLSIAEQSGKLSFTMRQIAEIYEDELETILARFASLAQPALLLLLGGLVGFVLLSVLLPLTDVSTFIN